MLIHMAAIIYKNVNFRIFFFYIIPKVDIIL